MADLQAKLTLAEYQNRALTADKKPDASLAFPLLGLFGEAGSLLSVVKKKQRDRASYLGYAPHVVEELGDVLWYFAVIAVQGFQAHKPAVHAGGGEPVPEDALPPYTRD